jgi:hypothetical protein
MGSVMAIAILSYLVVVGAHVALVMLVAHFPSWAVPAYVVMLTALFASGLVLRTRTRLPENKAAASTDRDAVLLGIWVVGWVGFLVWFAHDVVSGSPCSQRRVSAGLRVGRRICRVE